MTYPIVNDQKIDLPISVDITIGNDCVALLTIKAGIDVQTESKMLGGKAIVSFKKFKPDKNFSLLLNDLPGFMRMLADEIEAVANEST